MKISCDTDGTGLIIGIMLALVAVILTIGIIFGAGIEADKIVVLESKVETLEIQIEIIREILSNGQRGM